MRYLSVGRVRGLGKDILTNIAAGKGSIVDSKILGPALLPVNNFFQCKKCCRFALNLKAAHRHYKTDCEDAPYRFVQCSLGYFCYVCGLINTKRSDLLYHIVLQHDANSDNELAAYGISNRVLGRHAAEKADAQ